MGLREHSSPYVGLIFLLRLSFKTEMLTLEIVTCKLLLGKRPTISQFFQFSREASLLALAKSIY